MKTKSIAFIFLFLLFFFSCKKEETLVQTDFHRLLMGYWISPVYADSLVSYDKGESLLENQYGIEFMPNNKLRIRQNSGWCATPPIVTADYPGYWDCNDSIIHVEVGYWGGVSTFKWKVISVDNKKLTVITID